jgi:hypothetical protein
MKSAVAQHLFMCSILWALSGAAQGAITYLSSNRSVSATAVDVPAGAVSTTGFEDFDERIAPSAPAPYEFVRTAASQRSRLLQDRIDVECAATVEGISGPFPRFECQTFLNVVFEVDTPSWVTLYTGPIFRGIGQSSSSVFFGTSTTTIFSLISSSPPLSTLLQPGQYRFTVGAAASNRGIGASGQTAAIASLVIPSQPTIVCCFVVMICASRRRR